MAGVNLREENAQILTTMVGSVVQSCQDQPFLSPNLMLSRILHTGTRVHTEPFSIFTPLILHMEILQKMTEMYYDCSNELNTLSVCSDNDMRCFVLLGQALGVTDVGPDVVALVSHATQECLRGMLEKLTVMAEHRKAALKVQQADP